MTPLVAEIATHVDRLVWSVNDLASFVPDPAVAAVIASSDEEMSRSISHFAVFWLEAPLELSLAEQRFPYDPPGRVSGRFARRDECGMEAHRGVRSDPRAGCFRTPGGERRPVEGGSPHLHCVGGTGHVVDRTGSSSGSSACSAVGGWRAAAALVRSNDLVAVSPPARSRGVMVGGRDASS